MPSVHASHQLEPPPETAPRSLGAGRVGLRLLSFLLALICLDLVARALWTPQIQQDYTAAYRLPEDLETPFLNNYLRAIRDHEPSKIVFLGSSPTYGVNIQNPERTYPEVLEGALKAEGLQAEVFNVAAKGYLMSDVHFVLKSLVQDVQMVYLQLNYHTFSPRLLSQTAMRHPEIPEQLGVSVSSAEARALGLRPSPRVNLNQPLRALLQRHWFLYGQRAELAHLWLGDTPEAWVYHRFFKQENEEHSFKPFYELKPARQTFMVKRYAQNVDFEVDADNVELRFLRRSLELLKAHGVPTVVFMAPINVDALNFYELFHAQQYRDNVAQIQQVVEGQGFQWVDVNLSDPLPEDMFADISHTLNEGGSHFGQSLYQQSREVLRQGLQP